MIGNDVQPLIVIAITARRMIHRAGRIHFIVDHNLFQVHQPIVLIHENRNTGQMQRLEGRALFHILGALSISDQPHINSALLRFDHGRHCARRGEPIGRYIEIARRMSIKRREAIERRVVRAVIDLHRRAPSDPEWRQKRQDDESPRQRDSARPDCIHRRQMAGRSHSSSNNILK